jgi:phosphoglycolate phosphatase
LDLLFDLDGTLTDSRPGIVRCIEHALTEVGVPSPGLDALTTYVGPPLPRSFATLLGTSDPKRIELAIASYRRRFEEVGMFENRLYPGIDAVLAELAGAGHRLHLVTAKPRVYAARILEHFKLSGCFRGVFGPELGQRDYSKETLIHQACASGEVDVTGSAGRTAVMLRFGTWPTLICAISFRALTSMTDTKFECALATYSFLLSSVNVNQSGTLPTLTAPRYFKSGIE